MNYTLDAKPFNWEFPRGPKPGFLQPHSLPIAPARNRAYFPQGFKNHQLDGRSVAGARGWDRAKTSFFHHQTGHVARLDLRQPGRLGQIRFVIYIYI